MTLVGPGVTTRILISANPAPPDAYAVQELATYLEKITGQRVEVVKRDDTLEGSDSSPVIVLGMHQANADLQAHAMGHDSFVIDVQPGVVRIAGGHSEIVEQPDGQARPRQYRGTLNGVYTFLDQQGVRWYNPTPHGEHVPRKPVISLSLGRQSHAPAYRYRMGASLYRWYADQTQEEWDAAVVWDRRNRTNRTTAKIQNLERFGGSSAVPTHHNISNLLPRGLYEKHPAYFALVNGERVKPARHFHLCVSNPQPGRVKTCRPAWKGTATQALFFRWAGVGPDRKGMEKNAFLGGRRATLSRRKDFYSESEGDAMPTPDYSDTTTHDIRVGATGFYLPAESNPGQGEYVFGYRILIVNQGSQPAKLLTRRWVIIDGDGQDRHVQGHGVVGQTPRLEPGQAFKYSSFCPMGTSWGTMEGSYRMQYDDGQEFDVAIARFYLAMDKLDSAEPDERLTQDADPSPQTRL